MLEILPQELKNLAKACPTPLYVVGGSVRDYLAGLTPSIRDWDICAPLIAEEFAALARANGFQVQAVYRNTGTVKIKGEFDYEYACFRCDKYVRGTHVPVEIYFTKDIRLDAKRRDFTANALYFDVAKGELVDPLGGLSAIREKRLSTVDDPNKVFGEDGLRLLRLARLAAQLGFSPDEPCLSGAKANAKLIQDISPERIFEELVALLTAERKCGVQDAPYRGLRLLDEIGVFAYLFPELAKGKGLAQRADFHKYDVLEHSFRAVKYAETLNGGTTLRLAALLHDVGKPTCMLRDGNAHGHSEEGVPLVKEILTRLKAPKKVVQKVAWLTEWHMYDFDCRTGENKLRRFLLSNYEDLELLLQLKQADFSACVDDTSTAPTCARWKGVLAKMQEEGVPFSLKELAVGGRDLLDAGIPPHHVALLLNRLFMHVAVNPRDNEKARLLRLAKGIEKELSQKIE